MLHRISEQGTRDQTLYEPGGGEGLGREPDPPRRTCQAKEKGTVRAPGNPYQREIQHVKSGTFWTSLKRSIIRERINFTV